MVAAAAQPGGHLLVRNIGLNDTRTAVLGVLVRMGAQVREAIEDVDQLEPRGIVEGESIPMEFLPRLIELWQRGEFPVERMMTFYDFDQIDQAARDAEAGHVIKPVLRIS